MRGTVLNRSGGRYQIHTVSGSVEASLRGRFKQDRRPRVLVGDRVTLRVHRDGLATIEQVLPRDSVLKRRTPGGRSGIRAIAANVEQVAVVGATHQPDWDPRLMDRFVAVAEVNKLPITVVVNKCDLEPNADALGAPYATAGYQVIRTSVPTREGLAALYDRLEGKTSLFTGPTGVGKSSLLNALQPGLQLRTAPVSRKARSGRHTTVAAEMYPFGQSGFVVDTPGLRDIGLWGLEPQEVAAAFPEFSEYALECRFDNCRHLEEPDCGVVRAVGQGIIASSRLESYRQLLDEAMEAARPWQ